MTMGAAEELWEKLNSKRQSSLYRARECAELTIPGLLPPEGHDETNPLPTPYQSLGARGVNNLASKLLLALLPPNETFFKFEPAPEVMEELKARNKDAVSGAKKRLSRIEQSVLAEIESGNYRPTLFEALRHLVAVGDVLVHVPKEGGMKLYRLDQYVVRRDRAGNILDIVIKEKVSPEVLDERTRETCKIEQTNDEGDKNVEVYTHVRRKEDKWKVNQEINGIGVPGSAGRHPLKKPAYLALRWTAIPGENFGRGLVEEHLGDMRSLEGISKSIVRFAANASKIVWLVNPNGMTRQKNLSKAESGDFVPGREEDISLLGLDKFADFRTVKDTEQTITQRLHQAFLLNASIQRDAERVTAEEIQTMARELEDALGGVYSVLSEEFQRPFIQRVMSRLQSKGKIPELPDDIVKTKITTGLEALGRGHDLQKLQGLLRLWHETIPEEVLSQKVDWDDIMTRSAAAYGVDTSGLLKPPQKQQQEAQQHMAQQAVDGAAPEAGKEMVRQVGSQIQNTQ